MQETYSAQKAANRPTQAIAAKQDHVSLLQGYGLHINGDGFFVAQATAQNMAAADLFALIEKVKLLFQ